MNFYQIPQKLLYIMVSVYGSRCCILLANGRVFTMLFITLNEYVEYCQLNPSHKLTHKLEML